MPKIVDAPLPFCPSTRSHAGAISTDVPAKGRDQPLPVEPGYEGAATVTIVSGVTLSGAIDLAHQWLHRIAIPSGWTTATISCKGSGTA